MAKVSVHPITKALVFSIILSILATQPVSAFKKGSHKDITLEALQTITKTIDGKTFKFTAKAIDQIQEANGGTDNPILYGPSLLDSYKHFDNEEFYAASKHLIELREGIIKDITSNPPNGEAARQALGTALHTVQDFFTHSNYVELRNLGVNPIAPLFGFSLYANPPETTPYCPYRPDKLEGAGLYELTSGYYFGYLGCDKELLPVGKCYHGFPGPTGCAGINKDDPSNPNYQKARDEAKLFSIDYVNVILNDPRVENNAKAIKTLMGLTNSFAVVIELGAFSPLGFSVIREPQKAVISQVLNSLIGTANEPDKYVLVPFASFFLGDVIVTDNPNDFLTAIDAALAQDTSMVQYVIALTALQRAILESENDSTILLFPLSEPLEMVYNTPRWPSQGESCPNYIDFNCEKPFTLDDAIAAAQDKRIKVYPVGWFPPMGDVGLFFSRLAMETEGQIEFERFPEGFSQIPSLISAQIMNNYVTAWSMQGTLSPDSHKFAIPVASNLSHLVLSVSGEVTGSIALQGPSGVVIKPGDPGVVFTDLDAQHIVTIDAPENGEWQLQVVGSGTFSIKELADSSIEFLDFKFVTLNSGMDETGFVTLSEQLVAGAEYTTVAKLLGPVTTANFMLVNEVGDTIQSVDLSQGNPSAAANEYVGAFKLPSKPFKVMVKGADTKGQSYQRLFPALFRPQSEKAIPVSANEVVTASVPATPTLMLETGIITTPFGFMKQFESSEHPFSIQYPAAWSKFPAEYSKYGEVSFLDEQNGYMLTIFEEELPLTGTTTIDGYLARSVDRLFSDLGKGDIQRKQILTNQNLQAEDVTITFPSGKAHWFIYLHEDNVAFNAIYMASTFRYERVEPLSTYSFNSFQVAGIEMPKACILSVSSGIWISGTIDFVGDQDRCVFTATPGQKIYVEESVGNPLIGRLEDSTRHEIFQGNLNELGLQTLPQGGTYTITVSANVNRGSIGSYQFRVWNVPPPDKFAIRIGDTVTKGKPEPGAGEIETPGTMDIYTFEAHPGQMVYFDMLEPLAPDLLWRVTDSSEQDIFRTDSGGNRYRAFIGDPGAYTLENGGTYAILVWGRGSATGTYQFQIKESK